MLARYYAEKISDLSLLRTLIERAADVAGGNVMELVAEIAGRTEARSTSGNILSKLEATRYDPARRLPDVEPVFLLGKVAICTRGNPSTITAQSKSGKSSFLAGMIAATFKDAHHGGDTFTVSGLNAKGLDVVHFDTEQHGKHHERMMDELGRYSLVRAVRLASEGRSLDGLEREVHDEIARQMPQAPRGILVPLESRAGMSVTGGANGSEGGVMVAISKGQIIDFLRPKLDVRDLGATVLTGLAGDLDLPRADAATNASWKGEITAHDASNPSLSQLSLRTKRVGTFTEVSRQLLIQGSPDVETWLRNDLGSALAAAWEAAAIAGTGQNAGGLGYP